MFSLLFVLNARGDVILLKDEFFHDSLESILVTELFFEHISKIPKELRKPELSVGKLSFIFIHDGENGLYFVLSRDVGLRSPKSNGISCFSSEFETIEFLFHIRTLLKDFLGTLSEESLRKNIPLAYEILEEVLDFGLPQITSVSSLKKFIFNRAIPVENKEIMLASSSVSRTDNSQNHILNSRGRTTSLGERSSSRKETFWSSTTSAANLLDSFMETTSSFFGEKKSIPSSATEKPVSAHESQVGNFIGVSSIITNIPGMIPERAEKIFVDIVEKITVIFRTDGSVLHKNVCGSIIIRNFVDRYPCVQLAFNEPLYIVGKAMPALEDAISSSIVFDDCLFHSCINQGRFFAQFLRSSSIQCLSSSGSSMSSSDQQTKAGTILEFCPPLGEIHLLQYRISNRLQLPFRLEHSLEQYPSRVDVFIRISAEFPAIYYGHNVTVCFPYPKSEISSVSWELDSTNDGQRCYLDELNGKISWSTSKIFGNTSQLLRVKLFLRSESAIQSLFRKIGFPPISVHFEIPSWTCSSVRVRSMKVIESHVDGKSLSPSRWIRYISQSCSYIVRNNRSF